MLVMGQYGLSKLLSRMMYPLGQSPYTAFSVYLFKNDLTPNVDTAFGEFVEADFSAYAPIPIPDNGWDTAGYDAGVQTAIRTDAPLIWTCGASGNIVYGYYVVDTDAGDWVFAERFDSPRELVAGDRLELSPQFTLRNYA